LSEEVTMTVDNISGHIIWNGAYGWIWAVPGWLVVRRTRIPW